MEHHDLGSALLQVGDLQGAERHLTESLRLVQGGVTEQLPYALLGLAGLAARHDDPAVAVSCSGAVQAHFEREDEVLDPAEQLKLASHLEAGRAARGPLRRGTRGGALAQSPTGRSLLAQGLDSGQSRRAPRHTGRPRWPI